MKTTDLSAHLLELLDAVRERRPELRIGQIFAIAGTLAEDETGRSLWDVEDPELAAALERFLGDLTRRESEATGKT